MIRAHSLHLVLSLLVVCIVIVSIWLSQQLSISVDVTANKRHSLSDTTIELLNSINGTIEFTAIVGADPAVRQPINAIIQRLQSVKADINLNYINPETDPAAARALNAAPGGELILKNNDKEQRLQTVSERQIANSLRLLISGKERQIAFISGHGERSPEALGNEDWKTVTDRLQRVGIINNEYSLVSDPHIDENISLVVLAAPQLPYFPGEMASLLNYLERGGNLLWLQEPETSQSTINSLQLLSDTLGVDFLPGRIIDTASQVLTTDTPDFVLLDQFPQHEVTRILRAPLLIPQATALAATPLAGQTLLPLLQTPENSWLETGPISGEIRFSEGEIAGPLLIGLTIERRLPDNQYQRVAILGDADFASSQFIDNGGNQTFTEALLLWLTNNQGELDFISRPAEDEQLDLSKNSIIVLSIIYLVGLPLAFLLTALVVRWQRNRLA